MTDLLLLYPATWDRVLTERTICPHLGPHITVYQVSHQSGISWILYEFVNTSPCQENSLNFTDINEIQEKIWNIVIVSEFLIYFGENYLPWM